MKSRFLQKTDLQSWLAGGRVSQNKPKFARATFFRGSGQNRQQALEIQSCMFWFQLHSFVRPGGGFRRASTARSLARKIQDWHVADPDPHGLRMLSNKISWLLAARLCRFAGVPFWGDPPNTNEMCLVSNSNHKIGVPSKQTNPFRETPSWKASLPLFALLMPKTLR